MRPVYIGGQGLVSCLGRNLAQATRNASGPWAGEFRAIKGLDVSVPFHAIVEQGSSAPDDVTAGDWWLRCQHYVSRALDEAQCHDKTAPLFLGSSSGNVGAVQNPAQGQQPLTGFLDQLARALDWQGPIFWVNTACTSSLNALLQAQNAIAHGVYEEAVVIGLELENYLSLAGFAGMQLLAGERAQPLAKNRDGLALGEAVAALRLTAQPGMWHLKGGAHVVDSREPSGASAAAYATMLARAFEHAQLSAAAIDLVKLQAAGSKINDAIEAQAVRATFAELPPLLSFKALLGHTLGASGAAELALLLALLEGDQVPDLSLAEDQLDNELGVNFAAAIPDQPRHILSVNLGFGGSHGCVVVARVTGDD